MITRRRAAVLSVIVKLQSNRAFSVRAGSQSLPLVRCAAPPITAQQIYGVGGQQQPQPHLYGVVVPMTKLPRATGDGLTRVTGSPVDWNLQTAQHCQQSWPSNPSTSIISRSVTSGYMNY